MYYEKRFSFNVETHIERLRLFYESIVRNFIPTNIKKDDIPPDFRQ